jgi:chromosome segregation ATPase
MTDQHRRYTLAEVAQFTGLSLEAIRLRIRRGKLTGEKGPDGLGVILTSAEVAGIAAKQERRRIPAPAADRNNTVKALKDAVDVLRHQLAYERERADRAEAALAEVRLRLGRSEGEAAGLRNALQISEARADMEREVRQVAEDRAELTEDLVSLEREAHQAAQAGLADQRERTGRAEGEAETLRAALREDAAREHAVARALLQAEAERQTAEAARSELAAWTAGGPLRRALRRFFRRG